MSGKNNTERSAVSWLAELAASQKWKYLASVLLALIGVLCSIAPYLVIIEVIQTLLAGKADLHFFLSKCLVMALWWIIRYAFHAASTATSHIATFAVLADIRRRLLDKLAKLPLGTVLERSSGSYKSTIVERVDSIETTLAHIVPELTGNIIGAVVVFILMLNLDWRLGLALLIPIPIGFLCAMLMFVGYEKKFRRTVEATKNLNDIAVEYINGIEVIKTFGQAKTSYERFVSAAKEGADCFIDWMKSCLFGQTAAFAILPSTLLGLLPAGCVLCMNGTLSAGTFISAIVLSFGVMAPLLTAASFMDDITQMNTIVGEVADILKQEDMKRPSEAKKMPHDNSIELKDVHFSYKDKEVLHGINLEIKPGAVNALVGPSGSGKSTIARLVASLWDVNSGSILLGGVDLKDLPLSVCSDRVAYVSQENYLFALSVMENIRMGRKGATDEEVISAAKRCGCHDFIMSLENGYQTVCGSFGGHLSGGERQRIAIARAMLKDAPIVILDEATSYTDPENEAVVQSALAHLIQGKTLLVIAHRLSTVTDADNIIVVNGGNIEAQGTHEQLIDSCALYRTMWEAHISAKDRDEEVTANA